jgi:hypothetical protein
MLGQVHHTTFVRQATNLWVLKEREWYLIRDRLLRYDPCWSWSIACHCPSVALPMLTAVCALGGVGGYGKDHSQRQTFYGFRLHLRLCWQGDITQVSLASANEQDFEIALVLTRHTTGMALGDRNY